jgi:hypothetical protein
MFNLGEFTFQHFGESGKKKGRSILRTLAH